MIYLYGFICLAVGFLMGLQTGRVEADINFKWKKKYFELLTLYTQETLQIKVRRVR